MPAQAAPEFLSSRWMNKAGVFVSRLFYTIAADTTTCRHDTDETRLIGTAKHAYTDDAMSSMMLLTNHDRVFKFESDVQ